MPSLVTALLGVTIGMRHALEPDHLAAVSTLATEQRSPRAGLWLGALWGIGHSLSLLVVGGGLALLEAQMPERLGVMLELLVAVMIIGLGARAILRSVREGGVGRKGPHAHGESVHTHPAPDQHLHLRSWTFSTRPLIIGVVHGLAGSGALTALVLAELPSSVARLSYIALFGAGSLVGMAMLTGLAGLPLMRAARSPRLSAWVLGLAGCLSSAGGLWWGFDSGLKLLAG